MKKVLLVLGLAMAGLLQADSQPAIAAEKVIVKRYVMGNCLIIKTRRWDEQRHHWDVTTVRKCH